MAMRKSYAKKRANARRRFRNRKGKKVQRKSNVPRGLTTQNNQICRVVETVAYNDIQPNTVSTAFFTLMQFERARYLSAGFQYYKAAKCTWTYEALYNTFQEAAIPGGIVGDTVPQLYATMNRTGDAAIPNTIESMQGMGSRPTKFTRTHKISYKPNWNTPGLPVSVNIIGGATTQYMAGSQACYNWIENTNFLQVTNVGTPAQNNSGQLIHHISDSLNTDAGINAPSNNQSPSSLAHSVVWNGHDVYFQQLQSNNDVPVARLVLTVEWHFKKPIWNYNVTQNYKTQSG